MVLIRSKIHSVLPRADSLFQISTFNVRIQLSYQIRLEPAQNVNIFVQIQQIFIFQIDPINPPLATILESTNLAITKVSQGKSSYPGIPLLPPACLSCFSPSSLLVLLADPHNSSNLFNTSAHAQHIPASPSYKLTGLSGLRISPR